LICADGSSSAATVTPETAFGNGLTFDDLAPGDDITLTVSDSSLLPPDPLRAIPSAATVDSLSALARRPTPTPRPVPAAAPQPISQPVSQPAAAPQRSSAPAPVSPPVTQATAPPQPAQATVPPQAPRQATVPPQR